MASDQEKLSGTYTTWMGLPVFLNIITGKIKTSLFCTIIGESDATVRVRIADEWDVEIYKEMVQAVDAFPHTGMNLAPQDPGELNPTAQSAHLPATANAQPRTDGAND
jgi:hypothetical protein